MTHARDKHSDDAIDALAEALRPYDARVAYVMDRLVPFRDERGYGIDRALVAGGRMFGVGKRRMRELVRGHARQRRSRIFTSGFLQQASKERAQRVMDAVPSVREYCGYVYRARLVDFPHIFKVGFTTDPVRRERELTYVAKTPVTMESVEAGTYFEEAFRLLVFGRLQIHTEWFLDPTLPVVAMPEFLAHGRSVDEWRRAAFRNYERGSAGLNTVGALSEIYVEELSARRAA